MQLLLSTPKKFHINLLYCCFYFPYPKRSAKIYYAILLLLLSIQFFFAKIYYIATLTFYTQNIPHKPTILLRLLSIPYYIATLTLYTLKILQKYYTTSFTFYTQKIPQKSSTLLLLLTKPKKFYYISTFTFYTQKIP